MYRQLVTFIEIRIGIIDGLSVLAFFRSICIAIFITKNHQNFLYARARFGEIASQRQHLA